MFTEESGTGFFTKMKNVFSSTEKSNTSEVESTNIDSNETEKTNCEKNPSELISELTYQSQVSDESVTEREIPVRTVEVTAPSYTLPSEKDLDIRFATKFVESGGKFIFCESISDAIENLRALKTDNNWSHVFCWENEVKDAFCNNNFQKGAIGFTIGNSEAAISLCESLIAEDGTIILNPKQASRRRLNCFPKTHIIITDIAHLAATESDGLEKFAALNKNELPSIIKLGTCNTSHFYDKQRLILNSEGTEDIYIFLVDEVIPPSLRP